MITTISFDADQTLWDQRGVMRGTYGRVLEEFKRHNRGAAASVSVENFIEDRMRAAEEFRGKPDLEELRQRGIQLTLMRAGIFDFRLVTELNDLYLEHRFDSVEIFPEVIETLTQLKHEYTMGLISNGADYPRGRGFEELFDFVVFANDHDFEKPDPRLFEMAFQAAQAGPTNFAHVGDSLVDDISGSRAAGCFGIWINRDQEVAEGIIPDAEISSLTELRVTIDRISLVQNPLSFDESVTAWS